MVIEMKEDIMKGVHEKNASILTEVKEAVTNCMIKYPNNNFLPSDPNTDEGGSTG